ncbi:MAG: NUDIX hydrolase [Acidimicrobiales bacterium]
MAADPTPVPVRDAATVMLVRDAPSGGALEVFMLRRNLNSDFVGGAYVFPGGGVDATDRSDDLEAICTGRDDAQASDILGIPHGGLAFWVAAVRECFEEAGVLLAKDRSGAVISFAEPSTATRFEEHRAAMNAGETSLIEVCRAEDLVLDVTAMHYFAHWITPIGPPRRYDTRFFVGAAPPEQVPLHDNREVIANLWITPGDALARYAKGEFELIMPTIKNLQALDRFSSSADLLEAARTMGDIPAILPRIGRGPEGVRILLPGDEGFDEAIDEVIRPGEVIPGAARGARADG